jgi:hypothetical protein
MNQDISLEKDKMSCFYSHGIIRYLQYILKDKDNKNNFHNEIVLHRALAR